MTFTRLSLVVLDVIVYFQIPSPSRNVVHTRPLGDTAESIADMLEAVRTVDSVDRETVCTLPLLSHWSLSPLKAYRFSPMAVRLFLYVVSVVAYALLGRLGNAENPDRLRRALPR